MSHTQAVSVSLNSQISKSMCDHKYFIRDNLHSTFYATVCCSRHQDSLHITGTVYNKTSFLLRVLHISNWCMFSLKMTHKETKHVGYIMFQVLKIRTLTGCSFGWYTVYSTLFVYSIQYIICTLFDH